MNKLTNDEVAQYERDGYVIYDRPVFTDGQFQRLNAIFEEHLAAAGEQHKRSDELDTPHFADPRLLDFLFDDSVLDVVDQLIGPDIGLWSSHFISKEPKVGRATPWHTDSDYWEGRFDQFNGIVTVWLAIDRSDRGNGCMRVVPGTHRSSGRTYAAVDSASNTFGTEIQGVDEADAVYFELDPNECSLHDSRLVHGAAANQSDRRRCGYTMRYFSQQMRFYADREVNRNHRIWHCRGANPHGNRVQN